MWRGILACLTGLAAVGPLWAADVPQQGRVVFVKDSDTVVLASGQDVRLVDINTPEGPVGDLPAEPFADEARARLRSLVLNRDVRLEAARQPYDKYGRLLAQIYVSDTWLNGLKKLGGRRCFTTVMRHHQHITREI